MGLKEELIRLREKKEKKDNGKRYIQLNTSTNKIKPDTKIDEYLKKYDIDSFFEHTKESTIKNLIEKIAVWYELRYPEYEINRILHCIGQEEKDVNKIMFKENQYLKELDEDKNYDNLEWSKLYNAHAFISSLPENEKWLIERPRYAHVIYIEPKEFNYHLYLTRNGVVDGADGISKNTNGLISDEEVIGLHLDQVLELFEERNINLSENNGIKRELDIVKKVSEIKESIFDCAMYRIMARNPGRIGCRRAFLFAKEFDRNVDIPMIYAVDRTDPGLRYLINEYIKAGGHKDLMCYNGGLYTINSNEKVELISIQELIETQSNDAATFYTKEEDELHKRLINSLSSLIPKELEEEKVKKLRIERKIKKNKLDSLD